MVTSGLTEPRVIRPAPNGDRFVADSATNTVRVLRVPAGSAEPTKVEVFAGGLYQPYGIAFYPPGPNPEWVYIANSDSVARYPYRNGDLTATGKPEKIVERTGKPTGEYEDFMTGFVISDKQVWGRPVGVAVAQDGSLFVTEDGNGTIWRVTHQRTASQ
jgi:glucose/arabinose dehydrogenase